MFTWSLILVLLLLLVPIFLLNKLTSSARTDNFFFQITTHTDTGRLCCLRKETLDTVLQSVVSMEEKLPTSYGKPNVEKSSFEYIMDRHTFSGLLVGLTRVLLQKGML
jgi:hypothetical protein